MILKMKLNTRVGFVDATASGNGTIVRGLGGFEDVANNLDVHIRTALSQHCLVGTKNARFRKGVNMQDSRHGFWRPDVSLLVDDDDGNDP